MMWTPPSSCWHASRSRSSDPASAASAAIASVRRPRSLDFGRHRLDPVGAAAGDDDIGAGVGETEGEHAADAAGAAHDDGRPAAEIE